MIVSMLTLTSCERVVTADEAVCQLPSSVYARLPQVISKSLRPLGDRAAPSPALQSRSAPVSPRLQPRLIVGVLEEKLREAGREAVAQTSQAHICTWDVICSSIPSCFSFR